MQGEQEQEEQQVNLYWCEDGFGRRVRFMQLHRPEVSILLLIRSSCTGQNPEAVGDGGIGPLTARPRPWSGRTLQFMQMDS